MSSGSRTWTIVTVSAVLCATGLSACAHAPDRSNAERRQLRSIVRLLDEPVYVQLDGMGETPEGEFRPRDEEVYLEALTEELKASGLFPTAEAWSDAAPQGALVVDAHIDARIDLERSWSNAAWLMIVPVRTQGRVAITFQLKRNALVVESRRYSQAADTFAVPAAEISGHTWVETSGVLSTLVHRFVDDLKMNVAWRARAMERLAAN